MTGNMQAAVGAVGEINESLNGISHTFSDVASASTQVKREMDQLNAV